MREYDGDGKLVESKTYTVITTYLTEEGKTVEIIKQLRMKTKMTGNN
jgi:hypothetical protein